jgi:hypothetical protein
MLSFCWTYNSRSLGTLRNRRLDAYRTSMLGIIPFPSSICLLAREGKTRL